METEDTFVLVPLRNRKRLVPRCDTGCDDGVVCGRREPLPREDEEVTTTSVLCDCLRIRANKQHAGIGTKPPFVVLNDNNVGNASQLLGRVEFLEAMWAACCAHPRFSDSKNSIRCKCKDCENVASWAGTYIPRRLLRVEVTPSSSDHDRVISFWVRATKYATMNYVQLVPGEVTGTIAIPKTLTNMASVVYIPSVAAPNTEDTWMGPWKLQPGDILRFLVPPEFDERAGTSLPCLELELSTSCCCALESKSAASVAVGPHNWQTTITAKVDNASEETTRNNDAEFASSKVFLSQRSRYAAALQELDEAVAGDESIDDSASSCLASQPFESQQVPLGALALAAGGAVDKSGETTEAKHPIRKISETKIAEPLSELSVEPATVTSVPSLPDKSSGAVAESEAMPTKQLSVRVVSLEKDQDVTLSPQSFQSFVTTSLQAERRDFPMTATARIEPEARNVLTQTQGVVNTTLPATGIMENERANPSVVSFSIPPTNRASGQAAAQQQLMSSAPQPAKAMHLATSTAGSLPKNSTNKRRRATTSSKEVAITGPLIMLDDSLAVSDKKFVLYFVEKGSDMHKTVHVKGLRKHAEQRGAIVLDSFDKTQPPWPTHFVISQTVSSADTIASALGFQDLDEMSDFIGEHGIVCAIRKWAARGSYDKLQFKEPTMSEQYLGIRPNKKGKRESTDSSDEPTTSRRTRQRKDDVVAIIRNKDLSELFRKLSKLHQECPLFENDDWKAYTFQLLSGRLRHLDFEVKDDPEILKRLKAIKGFGDSSLQIVKEYLQTGSSSRVREFETNKQRVAMKAMMNIWGVGRARASELVNAGYQQIGSVRQAVKNGTLKLDRNQYIGLECYEDIMEEMTRAEAEAIAELVFATVKDRFPSAEMTIMGSYRRGKPSCGDVDILITHPDFTDAVPPKALGLVVDELRAKGYVAYHLTFISGMKHELFESLPPSVANRLTNPGSFGRSHDKKDKFSASSWMGVFNSPFVPGKRRRVDIKFYPYAERVFASLYFTGNGYFNRSMRLWATRKFNYTLSDHGILDKNTRQPVLKNPINEKEVFDLLGLKWKEPTERDCFDAVESISGETVSQLQNGLTEAEIRRENQEHTWID
jgi:DNA polymerase/3'-5' exonuclease PolX